MAQFARPNSQISNGGGWAWSGGASTYDSIDEVTASDTDYILSPSNPASAEITFGLSSVTDPNVSTGHVVRYRFAKSPGGSRRIDLTFALYQGTTLIASQTHQDIGTVGVTTNFPLTTGQADSITDYSNLRLQVTATAVGGGSAGGAKVTWAAVEVPDSGLSVAPDLLGGGSVFASTVTPGAISFTAPLVGASQVFGPQVVQRLSAAVLGGGLLYGPALSPGPLNLPWTVFIGGSSVYAPTVSLGAASQNIDAALLGFAQSFSPSLGLSIQAQLLAGSSLLSPAVNQQIPWTAALGGASVLAPALVQVLATTLLGGTSTFSPTLGQQVVTALLGVAGVFAPVVTHAATPWIINGTLLGQAQVYAASVGLSIQPGGVLAGAFRTFAPTVGQRIPWAVFIGGTSLYAPTVSVGTAFILPDRHEHGGIWINGVLPPTVVRSGRVDAELLGAAQLLSPSLVPGAVFVSPVLLAAAALLDPLVERITPGLVYLADVAAGASVVVSDSYYSVTLAQSSHEVVVTDVLAE